MSINDMKVGWNLGDFLDNYGDWILEDPAEIPNGFETARSNQTITKTLIQLIKAHSFNAIRLPVTWKHFISDSNDFKVKKLPLPCPAKENLPFFYYTI